MYRHLRLRPSSENCHKCKKGEGFIVWDSVREELVILCIDCIFVERIRDHEVQQIALLLA